jgi:hypothetical protein
MAAQEVPSTFELPQDAVEMHQDAEIKYQIIIPYLHKAKNVVPQVPRNQGHRVERGIAQKWQKRRNQVRARPRQLLEAKEK